LHSSDATSAKPNNFRPPEAQKSRPKKLKVQSANSTSDELH
jgi:hypothetical protein